MTSEMERKNVSLTIETYEKLKKMGTVGDSFEDVIKMLINYYQENNKK